MLTVAPLSSYLGLAGGVQSAHHGSPITHLLFMDDLKVFERSQEDLEAAVEGVVGLSTAVGMTLGAGKCAVAHLRAGRLRQKGGVEFQGDDIEEISGSTYRYLGIEQMIGIRSRETKDKVVREYLQRVQIVWSSPLSAGAKVRAHNSCVLRYRMAPLVWGRRELHKLDVDTRALMVKNKAHELSSDCDCLCLPRKEGGRGLIGVEKTCGKPTGPDPHQQS